MPAFSVVEFCCRSGGSNLNAGTLDGSSTEPSTSAVYTCTNSNWNGTTTFTPTDGSTPANTVSAGMYASVYLDADTTASYIAYVTNVAAGVNGAITLSSTIKAGSAPSSSATGRSIRVGGAWKGPNGTDAIPFGLVSHALASAATNSVRVNIKNDQVYSITAAMTHNTTAHIMFEGYNSSYGDNGVAIIDGGNSGASYTLLTFTTINNIRNIYFRGNGATGSADGCVGVGFWERCYFSGMVGAGLSFTSAGTAEECEAMYCNSSNTNNKAGFICSAASNYLRCISHHNSGLSRGFQATGGALNNYNDCISFLNGKEGFYIRTNSVSSNFINCDAYKNGSHGFLASESTTAVSTHLFINCNAVANSGWGIIISDSVVNNIAHAGGVRNCGFGGGAYVNSSGAIIIRGGLPRDENSITYDTHPWTNPDAGNFIISDYGAKGSGLNEFNSMLYGTFSGYIDVGAILHTPDTQYRRTTWNGGFIG